MSSKTTDFLVLAFIFLAAGAGLFQAVSYKPERLTLTCRIADKRQHVPRGNFITPAELDAGRDYRFSVVRNDLEDVVVDIEEVGS